MAATRMGVFEFTGHGLDDRDGAEMRPFGSRFGKAHFGARRKSEDPMIASEMWPITCTHAEYAAWVRESAMRGSNRFGAAFLSGVFGWVLAGGVSGIALQGQETAERFRVPSGIGATVSVATLRIPEKAWQHFAKAQAAAAHDRMAELLSETKKALAIAPDFAAAYLLRAEAELRSRQYDAAIADAREARRAEPDAMWSGVMLAGAYNGLKQFDDARQVLAGLRWPEANSWQAAYEGARAATGLHDVDSALRLSAAALEAAPENFSDVRIVRINAFLQAKRWPEAQEQMELYLQSKGPQERRSEVLAALDHVKRLAADEELRKVAER